MGVSFSDRSPEKCEGILIVGNAEGAERRDIERVADVREAVQAVEPPDGESRGGDRNADRQDERSPAAAGGAACAAIEAASSDVPLTAAGAALGLGQHESGVSRRSKIRSRTFRPS